MAPLKLFHVTAGNLCQTGGDARAWARPATIREYNPDRRSDSVRRKECYADCKNGRAERSRGDCTASLVSVTESAISRKDLPGGRGGGFDRRNLAWRIEKGVGCRPPCDVSSSNAALEMENLFRRNP